MSTPERVAVDPPAPAPGAERSPFAVGQVLPLELGPPVGRLRGLADLLEGGIPAELATRLRDPRVARAEWPRILTRELAMTLGWAARRARSRAGAAPAPAPAWDGRGRALVLLPAHGLAVHAVRRALPFALCGTPTRVVGHEGDRGRITGILAGIRALTGLRSEELAVCPDSAPEAVRRSAPDDLVVVTGSPRTAEAVTRESPARVLGATGGCTVLVGTDPERLRVTAALLREHDRPGSCTRLHGWRTVSGAASDRSAKDGSAPLGELHPSAVYRLDAPLDAPVGEEDGYAVLPVDGSGAVGTLVGFARDPRHRWPGDFLI